MQSNREATSSPAPGGGFANRGIPRPERGVVVVPVRPLGPETAALAVTAPLADAGVGGPAGAGRTPSNGRMFYTLLAVLLVVLGLYVWQLPRIGQYSLGAPTFVVYLVAGFAAAALLFGVLKSSATLHGSRWGWSVRMTGAAALLLALLGGGLAYEQWQRRDAFQVTLYVVSTADGRRVPVEGAVSLLTNPPRNAPVRDGVAEFRELPQTANGQEVEYTIESPGWESAPGAPGLIRLAAGGTQKVPVRAKQKAPPAIHTRGTATIPYGPRVPNWDFDTGRQVSWDDPAADVGFKANNPARLADSRASVYTARDGGAVLFPLEITLRDDEFGDDALAPLGLPDVAALHPARQLGEAAQKGVVACRTSEGRLCLFTFRFEADRFCVAWVTYRN